METMVQISCAVTARLSSAFVFTTQYNPSISLIHNFKLLAFSGCTARFVSNLVGNPKGRFYFVTAHTCTQYLSPSYCWCFLTHLVTLKENNMSHRMRKLTICICENKDADQLRSTCEADQRLCLRFTDSTISLLL